MPTKEQVQEVLDQIRPALQADGGDVELVDVCDDGVVIDLSRLRTVRVTQVAPFGAIWLSRSVTEEESSDPAQL